MRLAALPLLLPPLLAFAEENSSTLAPTPSASQSTFYIPITTLPPADLPRLDLRANPAAPAAPAAPVAPAVPAAPAAPINPGGAGAPAAAITTTAPTQAPTITTVMVNTVIGGIPKQVPVVYTQTFADVPSQGPSPLKGTIGLGTLTKHGAASTGGKVKRSEGRRSAPGTGVRVGVFAGVVGSIGGGLCGVLFG